MKDSRAFGDLSRYERYLRLRDIIQKRLETAPERRPIVWEPAAPYSIPQFINENADGLFEDGGSKVALDVYTDFMRETWGPQ